MTGTVTVACKLPHGLHLDLPDRPRITLRGVAVPVGVAPATPLAGGYALTHNIDEEFWEAWAHVHRDADIILKRLVFAYPKAPDAKAEATELKDNKSGLEPIDPDKPGKGLEKVGVGS